MPSRRTSGLCKPIEPRVGMSGVCVYCSAVRLSVIIPATDEPATLGEALSAIRAASDPPEEIIVIDHPRRLGASAARNTGATDAMGDVLVFIDADVAVAPDVFTRIRAHFAGDPELTAVFGAYDDDPSDRSIVSSFRNLLHHHVHRGSPGRASTFWSGIGAVKQSAFMEVEGFDEHYGRPSIEDIELGARLLDDGANIVLDPDIEGKHLKTWSLRDMVATDILRRGAPWIALILRQRAIPSTLNLGWRHRLSALMCLLAIVFAATSYFSLAAMAMVIFIGLNWRFYLLLITHRGPVFAIAGPALHALHHLSAIVSVPIGVGQHLRKPRPLQVDPLPPAPRPIDGSSAGDDRAVAAAR
jgi:glycosyltransferase involved in cell wall biosynthesis